MSKLLYIIAHGHSGSTLTDLLCGTIDGCFSTGELVYLPWQLKREDRKCIENQNICTCGKEFRDCPVWGQVIEALSKKTDNDISENPYCFRMSFINKQQYGSNTKLERCRRSAFFLGTRSRSLRSYVHLERQLGRKIIANNWLLYEELGKIAGSQWIVDSSKDYVRLLALALDNQDNVRPLVLIRSPLGIAASALKRYGVYKPYLKKWLAFYNERVYYTLKLLGDCKKLLVRYEGLCAEPIKTRNAIADFLGSDGQADYIDIDPKSNSHLVAGNPMRYRGSMRIRLDDRWGEVLSQDQVREIQTFQERLRPVFRSSHCSEIAISSQT